jgi:RNA polymerase sigma-70 factor (ECF subfamily)
MDAAQRAAVLAGDERAWRAAFDAAFGPLDAYVLWRCGGLRHDADDVLQEAWLIAVRRIESYDPQSGSLVAWLRGIAANLLRARYRRQQPESLPPGHDQAAGDEEAARARAEAVALALA